MKWKESESHWLDPEEEYENEQAKFGVPEFIYRVPDNPEDLKPTTDMWYGKNTHARGYGSGQKDIGTYNNPIWVNSYGSNTRENQLKNYPNNLVYGLNGSNPSRYRPTNVQDISAVRQIANDIYNQSLYDELQRIFDYGYID